MYTSVHVQVSVKQHLIMLLGASLVPNRLASNKGSGRLCLFLGTSLDLVQIMAA